MQKKWVDLTIFIFALIVAITITLVQKPLYEGWSTVVVDIKSQDLLETQKNIIKSRRTAYYVFKRLKLSDLTSFKKTSDPIELLLAKIKVEVVSNSRMLKIIAHDNNPKLASYIANEFAKVYTSSKIRRLHADNAWVQDFSDIPKQPLPYARNTKVVFFIVVIITGIVALASFIKKKEPLKEMKEERNQFSFDLPVLGNIPSVKINRYNIKRSKDIFRIAEKDVDSFASEAYRSMRVKLLASLEDFSSSTKSIVITSPSSQEGKTVTAVNLAIMIANSGERVLLVDTNIKRPKIHEVFSKNNRAGFFDFLSGVLDFDNIVKRSGIENLYFVGTGRSPDIFAKSVLSKKTQLFLDKSRMQFSKVIFDAPSLTTDIKDVALLSSVCSGVVLVTEKNKTSEEFFRKAKALLQNSGINLIGIVLNKENGLS